MPVMHNYSGSATLVQVELTTRQAAERLGVNQSRVRALVAAGRLAARRAGSQWLLDADTVDRQATLIAAGAKGRAMAPRVAWAAGVLADGGRVPWLSSADRSRLIKRLRQADHVEVVVRWLAARSSRVARFRIGESDVDELLRADGVVGTGVSASAALGLGLGTGGTADAYASDETAKRLVRDFFLIESRSGNLTLRIVDGALHQLASRIINGQHIAPRLFVGVDLAEDEDARAKTAGRDLITTALAGV